MSKLAHSGNADMDAIEQQGRALEDAADRAMARQEAENRKVEHSTLPWSLGQNAESAKNHAVCSQVTVIATVYAWGYPLGKGWSPESQANANFIVRACNSHYDLLDALKAVVSVADRKTEEFDAARAAIAKAEGK
jgi:hypothetical protein